MPLVHRLIEDRQSQDNFVDLDKPLTKLEQGPAVLTGARDDPEAALRHLIGLLEAKGLLHDSSTAT